MIWPAGGGGGYSPQVLVGMCRGKVKNWQGLRNELPVERENGGLRNELEPFWAWKWGAPERAWSVFSVKMGLSGTARTRLANPRRWKWDSPELPGRVWPTRGAENGTLRPGGGGGGTRLSNGRGVPLGGWKPDPVLNRSAHEKYTLF